MNGAVIERMTVSSSATLPTWGKSALTGMPLSPQGVNSQGLGQMSPSWLNIVRSVRNGIGRPASAASLGLGSNESTCDSPPDM